MTYTRSLWVNRGIVFGVAIAAAVLFAFTAPPWLRGTVRLVAGYDIAAAFILLGYFFFAFSNDEQRTRARAALDDPGRNIVLLVVIISVAAGLTGAIAILGKGSGTENASEHAAAIAVAILGAALGWLVTHATYAFRYAHLYYRVDDGTPCNGLSFPSTPVPDDFDFLYFSFVIGMTFQVSDVQVNDPAIRRLVLMHGMVSFVYNTAILALGINLVSNLLH
ncbi:MAG: DUF1345 domain-containing protein [Vulcanimicrobiaceae bacterium]